MIDQLKPLLGKLALFSQERMGFKHPPKLFLRNDSQNSQQALGKTAFYNPEKRSVTLFVHGRHPKDILRSFAHELVHHCQNERGDLSPDKITASGANYAQECPHMRKMEKEAYLKGNMCFRDWEDEYKLTLQESKFLKENKTMTTKITKEFLKETIKNVLLENESDSKVVSVPTVKITANEPESERKKAAREKIRDLPTIKALSNNLKEEDGIGPDTSIDVEDIPASKPDLTLTPEEKERKMAMIRAEIEKLAVELRKMEKAFSEVEPRIDEENETVDEGACSECGMSPCACPMHEEVELEENEELEESAFVVAADKAADAGKKEFEFPEGSGKMHPVRLKAGGDTIKEDKIQTPEQENTLYENRFAPRNNRLFEKLVKEWTK